jgi:hypothetical protein
VGVTQLYQVRNQLFGEGPRLGAPTLDSAARRDDFLYMREIGKLLVLLGGVFALIGFALWSGFGAGLLGRLPGDIRIERGNSAFYFPIVTCIIISIVLSLIFTLFRR